MSKHDYSHKALFFDTTVRNDFLFTGVLCQHRTPHQYCFARVTSYMIYGRWHLAWQHDDDHPKHLSNIYRVKK